MPKATAKGRRSVKQDSFCKYIHRHCFQKRIDGFDYCIRHILEDKRAPFRQCSYVEPANKKRCTNAALKSSEKGAGRDSYLCPWHTKKLQKKKVSHPKNVVIAEGPVALFRDLEHYCHRSSHNPAYERNHGLSEKYESTPHDQTVPPSLSAGAVTEGADFEDRKAESPPYTLVSDSRMDTIEQFAGFPYSLDDCLKHAGVFTEKEIVKLARQKTVALQGLYCQAVNECFNEFKETRKEYLATLKEENIGYNFSISSPFVLGINKIKTRETLKDKKLRALMNYHHPKGVEKILRRKAEERRAQLFGCSFDVPTLCSFRKDGKPCQEIAIYLTNFCMKHILFDPNQLLFKPCGYGKNGDCTIPVLRIEDNPACDVHLQCVLLKKTNQTVQNLSASDSVQEQEHFQSMDDIASLGLDVVTPGSLFGLDQFGEPGESTDTVLSEDQADLMQIQPITLNPPADILCDSSKSTSEDEQ